MSQVNAEVASALADRFDSADPETIYQAAITGLFASRVAVVSSFGTESAVSLSILASINPEIPVLFIDTGMHFPQTRDYVAELTERLGLLDVRHIQPCEAERSRIDPLNNLWRRDTDACCHFRKVVPLGDALAPFAAWVTGRKRYHGGLRSDLRAFEYEGGKFKINPLVNLSPDDIQSRFDATGLPRHPMEAMGYTSIGCWPCTEPSEGDDVRSGRWKGRDKTECGIHRDTLIQKI
jgi:phosphoadenosine phosphosulfate reductase